MPNVHNKASNLIVPSELDLPQLTKINYTKQISIYPIDIAWHYKTSFQRQCVSISSKNRFFVVFRKILSPQIHPKLTRRPYMTVRWYNFRLVLDVTRGPLVYYGRPSRPLLLLDAVTFQLIWWTFTIDPPHYFLSAHAKRFINLFSTFHIFSHVFR